MPSDVILETKLYCGRLAKYEYSIYDLATQLPVAIGSSDKILCKLSLQEGGAPVLDLTSDDYDGGTNGPPTASSVQIVTRGSVGNADPDSDYPARGIVWILSADTAKIPDAWSANAQNKRYWIELIHLPTSGEKTPFGKGRIVLHRSAS